ncbi:MAG: hypothetical protein JNK09_19770 [Prolixibacteraceae bacterium]|nr:hypothetical protein [Prolixibacteraceae bacterium]
MKRFLLFFMLSFGFAASVQAQNKDIKKSQPKEDIKVTREYDEQGNLIRFDSTYTYNWSSDTTLLNSMVPPDLDQIFKDHFSFFGDTNFFEDFDQQFLSLFGNKRDSVISKNFDWEKFNLFGFENDSVPLQKKEFDFFGQLAPEKSDSIVNKSQKLPLNGTPRTMEEMMKRMQKHMQEMEEMHQRFFDELPKPGNQPKVKDL